ncbi:type VI secretion system baseplate subunit TssF [Chryseobacterium gambrini]|uniref:Type VI secretion system baseplate subunit TssF n=1 Tax=Chryseobacterium gambrini TaxID=373672 RepID=A0AAJ1VKD6_9FLAO|nr:MULTISPECIES: type VI secretion system baseplate subunit TssF [Chryseobacterium]MDN4012681.1 type VI secretion system baseplate subunit TssF [Chryseobacterium gambrini]MDN4030435.1 type VI secretion system baseplate subunit TssF [Chryseobacterium gambrini]QWA39282.1 type VI secretion system baseplate subunit TssF [Chryseobacterium sp. ZHDP1]
MNLEQNIYSKESVKARMLQNATKVWGLKSPQSLDPFVKLLIDAFSTEVFKANNEIQTVNARILEKLAKLLTPSIYTHPIPSHAIAFTQPYEPSEILLEHTEFFFKKQMTSTIKSESDKQINIPFTPIGNIRINKIQTAIMFVGNTCYGIDDLLNKIPIARFQGRPEDYRKVTIGIDVSKYSNETFPKNVSIYCSNPAFEHLDFTYKLLPYITVSSNGNPLFVKEGLTYYKNNPAEGYEQMFREQSIQNKIIEDIKSVYHHKFIEISGLSASLFSEQGQLPENLSYVDYKEEITKYIDGKRYLWLTFEFPPQFSAEILDNFSFVLNAFPIYNRGWKKTEYSLDIMGNNIPLVTDEGEHFLYVDEVQDGDGRKYTEIPFTPNDDLRKGLYTVRKGGMERFTNRNAVDMIANVLELTRDEIAAFSLLNRDNVKGVLSEMSDKMKSMVQKVNNAKGSIKQELNYVIMEPVDKTDHTYASFWITHSTLANHMRPGTELSNQLKSQTLVLLTETIGGAEEQKGTDSIQTYKYALTTRDKIISLEDVKNYCRMVLKDELKEVKVTRGTMISNKPKEGFIRTVEVEIIPQNYSFYGRAYWENMANVLRNQIISKAIDGIEYLVKVTNEDSDFS